MNERQGATIEHVMPPRPYAVRLFAEVVTDGPDDLLQLCGLLVEAEGAPVMVRAAAADGGES